MKKAIYSLLAVCTILFTSSCDKEEMITSDEIPAISKTFLNDHFEGVTVSNVKKEKEGLSGTEYTVYLQNGIQVSFNKNGNWTEVDSPNNTAIPTTFILQNILTYVQERYPTTFITSIDKDANQYEVELSNGLDLEFDLAGNFKMID